MNRSYSGIQFANL